MSAIKLSPYADFLGIRVEGEVEGVPLLVMPAAEGLQGRPGMLHGGAIAGLLEIAAIAALEAAIEDAAPEVKPVTVTVDFMRAGANGDVRALGRVTRLGSRIANVAVEAWQDDPERPIAAARMNLVLGQGKGG